MSRSAILAVVLTLMVVNTIPAAASDVVYLGWRDSGYDLAAGYRYTIALESGVAAPFQYARAMVDAGPIRIKLEGSQLTIWVNGEPVFDEGVGEMAATVTVIVDHSGDGYIEVTGFGRVAGFSIEHSYRITIFTETVSCWPWRGSSHVVITRQALPPPQTSTTTNPNLQPMEDSSDTSKQIDTSGLWNWLAGALGGAATVAVVFIILLFGILAFAIAFRQARKRKLV